MCTHMRVLSESFPMNTNMKGFRLFSKILRSCALGDCILSIGRVKCPWLQSAVWSEPLGGKVLRFSHHNEILTLLAILPASKQTRFAKFSNDSFRNLPDEYWTAFVQRHPGSSSIQVSENSQLSLGELNPFTLRAAKTGLTILIILF